MNKSVYGLLIALLTLSTTAICQNRSLIYNNKAQLKADTSISLSPKAMKSWANIESDVLSSVFNYFVPPQFFIDAGVPIPSIFSFQYNQESKKFDNVKLYKLLGSQFTSKPLGEKTKQKLVKEAKKALNESISGHTIFTLKSEEEKFTYFIPIILGIKPIEEHINNEGMLIIQSSTYYIKPNNSTVH